MMATKRYNPVYDRYIPTRAYDAFETMVYGEVTNSSIFREINRPDTYAMIYQKGRIEYGPLRIKLKFLLKFLRNSCARTFTPERLHLEL